MARVAYESRNRVAIEWYDDEVEAQKRSRAVREGPGVDKANIGMVQVGRDRVFDRRVDGEWQYAVVTP